MTYLCKNTYTSAATTRERTALFNNCGVVSIEKETTPSGRLCFSVFNGTDTNGGFRESGDFRTLESALSYARKSFPNLPIYRTDGGEVMRILHLDSCYLSDLPARDSAESDPINRLQLDSQDIESALDADSRVAAGLKWHGMARGSITGVYEIPELGANGQYESMAALYATDWSRPFDLSAIYRRLV